MSCKMDTNVSLCFNTAAGCISRQQLVQFHNRMGPRAQRGLRCTVWQKKCHNSSFQTVWWFIGSQQFFSSEQMQNWGRARPFEDTGRLLNSALFTPDSSTRKISSSELLRSCTNTALSKTLCCTAVSPFTRRAIQSPSLQLCIRNTAFKGGKRTKWGCVAFWQHFLP